LCSSVRPSMANMSNIIPRLSCVVL
jgi:hypothetical protein